MPVPVAVFAERVAQPARAEAKTTPPPTAVSARKSRRCMVGSVVGTIRGDAVQLKRLAASLLVIPGHRAIHSMQLLRSRCFEVCDQVGAILRLWHVDAHTLARSEFLGIGEPAVERLFAPHDARTFQCFRIGEAGRLTRG